MTDFLLARFNANGVLDLTFGATGRTRTDFGGREVANALTLQPDGKILLAGYHSTDYTGEVSFALARYTADGELDGSFGARGRVTTAFARPHGGGAEDVAVQPNGRIVAAGGAEQDFALAGYRSGLAGAATPPPTSTPGCIFTDVCPGDFFYTPVEQLVLRGAISGYGDGTFQPYNSTTRSQLVKIVVVAAGFPLLDPSYPTFGDVPRHFAFYTYVETAVARGIISGYDVPGMAQREFRPFHGITRGQICKIVVKAAGWSLVDPPRPTFDDVPASNPFYRDIETAVAHGVISGYALPNGGREFRWFNPATRGQISKVIYEAVTR